MPDARYRMPEMNTNSSGGYEKLEIYQEAHALAVQIHAMSLKLPRLETYEEGSQIRRSSKRIPASIVEGYASRRYKDQFLLYLYRALGSSDETKEHLELLWETKSLCDSKTYFELSSQVQTLSRKISVFIAGVERNHRPVRLSEASGIRYPTSDIEEAP